MSCSGRASKPRLAVRQNAPDRRSDRSLNRMGRRADSPSAISIISKGQVIRISLDADFMRLTRTYPRQAREESPGRGEPVSEAEHQIAIEQQVVDKVYERLEVMRAQARELKEEGHSRATSGPLTGLVERDAMVLRAAAQMSDLDSQEEGIVFGRLDFDDGYTYRVGRSRRTRRGPGAAGGGLACTGCRAVLPGHARRTARRGPSTRHHLRRPEGGRARRRGAVQEGRRWRGRRGCPAPIADQGTRRAHARHRHHDPARAGRGDPRTGPRRHPDHRRSGHRQDAGGPAPGGLPALHRSRQVLRTAACWWSARRRCSPNTSAGCCPDSARTVSTCERSASCSRASPRPAATPPRWPVPRATCAWCRCSPTWPGTPRRTRPTTCAPSSADDLANGPPRDPEALRGARHQAQRRPRHRREGARPSC